MSNRRATFFYSFLIAVASLAAGMVLASRLDFTPASFARVINVPETNTASLDGPMDASTFRNIAHDQNPVVVSIRTRTPARLRAGARQGGGGLEEFFQQQQPPGRQQELPDAQGAGSGFIIDKTGFILTNNHVVEGATSINVFLYGMDENEPGLPAKVVGRDQLTDSALIQITEMPSAPLSEATFGDSEQLQPGDWVMAIGNPFGFSNTVTVGVVSAVGRTDSQLQPVPQRDLEMIQTDAAINRGNSGGPLLNIRGEVVGINTAIISDNNTGGNIGIGFAVPIHLVKEILPGLRNGRVIRGVIGVSVSSLPMTMADAKEYGLEKPGALIASVNPGGPADAAGMKPDDVVLEFDGKPVSRSTDLIYLVTRTKPGTAVPVKVFRGGKSLTLEVKIGELDLEADAGTVAVTPREPEPEPNAPVETGVGIMIEPVSPAMSRRLRIPQGRGAAVVAEVSPRSPAAGVIGAGDVILAINGRAVSSVDEVTEGLDKAAVGTLVRVLVWREGAEQVAVFRKR
ncbi:MAG: PDZ domain-containing protein [Acidobacteria bacterium]|nr:PDZ domain-containing protein [Acidobacteriota bacterium]